MNPEVPGQEQGMGKGPEEMADLAAGLEEPRGSGPGGAVREVPEGAQWGSDMNYAIHQSKDFLRSGMDNDDTNNFGPEGDPRLSHDKAEDAAYTPGLKDAEESFLAASQVFDQTKEAMEKSQHGFDKRSDTYWGDKTAHDRSRDELVTARQNLEQRHLDAHRTHEDEHRAK